MFEVQNLVAVVRRIGSVRRKFDRKYELKFDIKMYV